jgi:transposase
VSDSLPYSGGKASLCKYYFSSCWLSKPSVYKIVERYNKQGPLAIKCKLRGGRRNALLSVNEEEQLFINLEEQASKGLIKRLMTYDR